MNGIKNVGKCPKCGQFVKRGLWNYMMHPCPEDDHIIFSIDPNKCVLIKHKNLNKRNDK